MRSSFPKLRSGASVPGASTENAKEIGGHPHACRVCDSIPVKSHRTLLYFGLFLVCALVSSCKDKDEIKVYRVSKPEPEPASVEGSAPASPEMSGMPPMGALPGSGVPGPAAQTSQVTGTAPANWEAQTLSEMRQASYLVKGDNGATADISLVILAGSAGGVLENVNRWLSQLGQPAITADQLAKMAQQVASPLGDVTVVDLEGLPQGGDAKKDGRIIGGIASSDSRTIFFKMRGNAALAETQKGAFIQWIGSVKMSDAAASEGGSAAPAAPATTAAVAVPTADSEKPQIKWEVPEGWKTVAPTAMRYASFAVAGQNGESADISVSVFGGDGGGDLQNVNRWRTQIGLEAVDAEGMKSLVVPVTCKDGEIRTVDMTGPKGRILAGWALIDGKCWFFKLTAPDQLAAAEKDRFAKFLQSVQFHQ